MTDQNCDHGIFEATDDAGEITRWTWDVEITDDGRTACSKCKAIYVVDEESED